MNSDTVFRMTGEYPDIEFRPSGGVMTWQEWMCQPVALLGEASGDGGRVVLLSLQSGTALVSQAAPPELFSQLKRAKTHVLSSGDVPGAQAADAAIVKNEPFDASGFLYDGVRKQMRGELETAVESYLRAEADAPGLPRAANLRGLCLRLLGRNDEAEAAYRREMEISPFMPEAFANLGILCARTGRSAEARTMFEKALERDQFYFHALLHFAKLLAADEQRNSRLFASLNMRLLGAWADVPEAQSHLLAMAAACGASPAEFAARLRAEAGVFADPFVLQTMKRCEILRLNGALVAALRGYGVLLDRTGDTPVGPFFANWAQKRTALVETIVPNIYIEEWKTLKAELAARHPGLAPAPASAAAEGEAPPDARKAAMGPEEFYEIIVTEMLRDGQVSRREAELLGAFRTALRIPDHLHARIQEKAIAASARSPMTDGGGEFRAEAFLRRLAAAVIRDGKIDEQERKMVVLAAQALNLTTDAVKAAFREVTA